MYKHTIWGEKRGENGRKICPTAWDISKGPLYNSKGPLYTTESGALRR